MTNSGNQRAGPTTGNIDYTLDLFSSAGRAAAATMAGASATS
jgi:hypothetical protein